MKILRVPILFTIIHLLFSNGVTEVEGLSGLVGDVLHPNPNYNFP